MTAAVPTLSTDDGSRSCAATVTLQQPRYVATHCQILQSGEAGPGLCAATGGIFTISRVIPGLSAISSV